MRIQTKLILSIVPIVLVGFVVLSFLTFQAARDMMRANAFRYVDSVLESRLSQTFFRRTELLRNSKMDAVASFVALYQQEAQSALLVGSDSIVGCFLVFDRKGTLLSPANDCTTEPLLGTFRGSALQVASDPAHATLSRIADGTRHVYGVRYFEPWQWVLVYATELSGFEKAVNQILQFTIVVAIGCLALCTLVTVIVFRRVFGLPVVRLKAAAARIANREPDVFIAVDSQDEFGELSHSLNSMAKDISDYIRTLEHLRCALEKSNEAMKLEIAERRKAQMDLKNAHQKLTATLDAIPDILFEVDAQGQVLSYHARRTELLAAPAQAFLGRSFAEVLPPAAAQVCMDALGEAGARGFATGAVYSLPLPQGETWFELSVAVLPQADDGGPHFIVLARDITERRQTQQALQASLREKTALLLEIHHRVKNNLQVITSLLRLEERRASLDETRAVLQDMQGRVRAMALLHETIYRKDTFAAIDLASYIHDIAEQSLKVMQQAPGLVRLRMELASLQVNLDQATPCGLLVTELLSNCLKHGFPQGAGGEIHLQLTSLGETGHWRLQVSDNGRGLPPDFAARQSASLGLRLVADLATQIGGKLVIGAGPQAVFYVDFKAQVPAPLVINLA